MKAVLKKIIKFFLSRMPAKNIIVFESRPDLSDNTKAVFDEMLRRELNKKYKFIWLCFDKNSPNSFHKKDVILYQKKGFLRFCLLLRAKVVICCNRFVYSENIHSFNIFLGHGNPLKNTKDYYLPPDVFDALLTSSEGTQKIMSSFYSFHNLVALGYPRNDVFNMPKLNLQSFFKTSYKKIIVWYPTVRQFGPNDNRTNCNHALPIIWDSEKAIKLNCCAAENGALIVLKPHFAQDISFIKKINLSNIVFIDDDFFRNNNISSYRFVGSCDALLTDFSSIYYDYTLCDKPIGLIWEDYNQYNANPGFAVDMDSMMKGGVKIYNIEELCSFISDVANNVDELKEERRKIRDLVNISIDGNNSIRVVDYIIEKAQL